MKTYRKFFFGIHLLLIVTLIGLLLWYRSPYHILTPCPVQTLFHVACPFCGGTRAILCLLHFDFAGAFSYNPMIFLFIACAIYYEFYALRGLLTNNPHSMMESKAWPALALAVLLATYFVLRNII